MAKQERRLSKERRIDPQTRISVKRRTVTADVTMHLHDFYELELVLEGTGEQNLNGSIYPLEPGSIYFLTPIDFHAITLHTPLKVLCVLFEEGLISPELQASLLHRRSDLIFTDPEEAASLASLIARLEQELSGRDAFSHTARKHLLELLLFAIARGANTTDTPSKLSDSIQESMRYLFCHFRENITLEQIARQSGYSPNYFSHLFHRSCGIRFVDFLNRLRLNYARTMLLTTSASISEIAEASGFSSASNFFRAFRADTGLSPLEYRNSRSINSC